MKAAHVWGDGAISRPLEANRSFFCTGSYLMHHLCATEGSGSERRRGGGSAPRLCLHEWELTRQAPDCLRWGRCCYWLIIDRCSFHVYNGRKALRHATGWRKNVIKKKGCGFKVKRAESEIALAAAVRVVMQKPVGVFFFLLEAALRQWCSVVGLLLRLWSANVLTGCSSAPPPPFCSQAYSKFLHIFSKRKKKGKRRRWPSSCCCFVETWFYSSPRKWNNFNADVFFFFFTALVIGAGSREDESGGRVRRLPSTAVVCVCGRVVALSWNRATGEKGKFWRNLEMLLLVLSLYPSQPQNNVRVSH